MKRLRSAKSHEGDHGDGPSIDAEKQNIGGSATLLRYFVTRTSDENDAEERSGSSGEGDDIAAVALKKRPFVPL
jgi:hypothetical protein